MASSPSAPRAHSTPRITSNTPSVLLADVISYGFAAAVAFSALQLDMQFQLWQAVVLCVLFVLLRGVANELRRDAHKAAVRNARRIAAHRAQSPSRWTVEQRDGLGRRVDVGA